MKKMGFIKSRWLSSYTRLLSLALYFCFVAGLQSVQAQAVVAAFTAKDTTCTVKTLEACNGDVTSTSTRFTDDGTNDGNYTDPTGQYRRDTVEFCPKDKWHRVKVVFTDFDLEAGDSLFAYDGDKKAIREVIANQVGGPPSNMMFPGGGAVPNVKPSRLGIGSGSGVGVSKFVFCPELVGGGNKGSGWLEASCNPKKNPSGCITFILETDGDNRKGKGWDAWVDCEKRDIEFSKTTIADARLKCNETHARRMITAPFIIACGDTLRNSQDSVILRVQNQHGDICIDTCLARNSATPTFGGFGGEFAIGQYSAIFLLKGDTTKTQTTYFSVQAPSLICNDQVNVPLGAACMAALGPDDLLENPCDTIPGLMYYNITITLGSGKTQQVLKTTGHNDSSAVVYPVITSEVLKKAGISACGGTATVKIERIYFGDRGNDGVADTPLASDPEWRGCNNGAQALYCETNLVFSDESEPWIDITGPDTLIACDTTGFDRMLSATVYDNCETGLTSTYTVTFAESDPCFQNNGSEDTTLATVRYRAVDACGNVGTATKTITLIRPDLDSLKFVAKTKNVELECTDDAVMPMPGIKIGVWNNNAFEVKDTVQLSTTEYICGYILTSEEEDIPSTDCGKKKYKYWYALDWCEKDGPKILDTTFIEYTDKTAPLFVDSLAERVSVTNLGHKLKQSPNNVTIELDHFSCTYDVNKLPRPKAVDNCDAAPSVRIDSIYRIEDGGKWPIAASLWEKLDCDSFCVRWVAADDCHEQVKNDTVLQIIEVKDVTKPSAACTDQLNVSVPNEWGARVYVADIDAGSYDACGIKSRLIRIKGSGAAWTEFVTIGCEYVHPDLQIEMQVLDNKGNENICWLDVVVEDKINPYCEPLADVTEDCDKFHNGELGAATEVYASLTGDLATFYNTNFGDPKTLKRCEDNLNGTTCGELTLEQEYKLTEWPCGELKATRRYRAKDWSGNVSSWVEQTITIKYKANWKITLPSDWEGSCGDMAPAEAITIANGACDLLGYEVTEKQFEIPGDACFKIERTYHIINWCKYVAGDEPVELARTEGEHGFAAGFMVTSEGNEDKGYWTYVQVLKVHDDEAPVVTVIDPEPCINGIEYDALPYGEEDQTPGSSPYECDEPKTWTATATDCSSNISWEGKLYNAATGALVKEVKSHELTYVVSNKESYYAEFWAYDNCGNSGGNKGETVKFWDCKKPTPYVLNGIAVELMTTGMIQVWATDLNQNSFDNCTDQSKLDFRIWADFLGDAPSDLAGVQALGKVITFPCDRVGTNVVYIYVIDEEGNWDFAQTYVIVQDNGNACETVEPGNGGMVAGTIVNPNGENVESVSVAITGGAEESMTTGADGHFMFMMTTGSDYTVTPEKDINPLNGVSTFDLVLISKHILGINKFDDAYKYIAADVNKSGTITAFDMVQLRQLILNITTEFSNNDSWRFVDASYEFTTDNPASENFGEFYTINSLNANMENLDFVGVKIGDVNGNAQANSLLGAETRSTNGTLTLTTADRYVEAGQAVTVSFRAAEIAQTEGYQFTLNLAGQDASVVEGVAKAANFNTQSASRGVIATSWNGEATAEEALFAITFTPSTSGLISEMVSVSSDITQAEAYNVEGELMDVSIDFTTAAVAAGFELNQNTPNPFNGETVIGFNLPAAGSATLTVMDAQGKVLKLIEADYAKGANQVTLKANELGATGVLYYQLESADNVATKKMIIIE